MALREILEEEFDQDVVSSIELTGVDTSKLNADLVEAMQETVWYIRQNTGSYYVLCAHKLWELRNKCRGNKKSNPRFWTEFKKSGLLPFTPREITDLIAAWEGWLSKTNLDGEHFNLMGIRTLALVSSLNATQIKKIEAQLKAGERLTEKMVKQQFLPAPKAGKKAGKASQSMDAWIAENVKKYTVTVNKKTAPQLRKDIVSLKEKSLKLEQENKDLKARIKEFTKA